MSTVQQLIDSSSQRPFRRCYIKRRLTSDGTFEDDWQRIDIDEDTGNSRIISWGQCSIEIDSNPSEIGVFNVSSLNMIVDNSDGFFNAETSIQSFWYGYLNRKYTKIKVTVGYYDTDGSEVGEDVVFEGYVDKYTLRSDFSMSFMVLSYQSILTRYNIYELQQDSTISGQMTITDCVSAIMSQSYIQEFLPNQTISPDQDVTLAGTSEDYLVGTYWDVLSRLAVLSNSVIYLVGDTFAFQSRTIGLSSVHDFKGVGTASPDIYSISQYDDEGGESVRVWWQASGTTISASSTDATLIKKYLNQPESIDLDLIDSTSDKQDVLDAYLSNWENPRPTIEFRTKFFISLINPLDRISIEYLAQLSIDTFYWDAWIWDDGSLWGRYIGPLNITTGDVWMVTKVTKDIDNFFFSIKAEKQ